MSELEYNVLRKGDCEDPFTGMYNNHFAEKGTYNCKACGASLFVANQKFHSDCGWPAFFDAIPNAIVMKNDGPRKTKWKEACCGKCDSHLGICSKAKNTKPLSTSDIA